MRMSFRLGLLALLLTAACAGPPKATAPPPTDPPVAAATNTVAVAEPTLAGATEAAPEVAATSETVVESPPPPTEAVATEATATRAPRLALEATDPSTVSLAAGKPQLVEFFAFWWTTCQRMAPIVHGLEDRYSDRMAFSYLDIDDPATAEFRAALGFRYQPELYLLDAQGQLIQKWIGAVPEQDLAAAFDAAIGQ